MQITAPHFCAAVELRDEIIIRAAPHANALFKEKYSIRLVELVDDAKFKTVQMKEAKAQADCAKEYLDYKLQEALLDAARSAVYTYRALLSAWQSKSGNLRAERDVANVGTPGPNSGWSHRQF